MIPHRLTRRTVGGNCPPAGTSRGRGPLPARAGTGLSPAGGLPSLACRLDLVCPASRVLGGSRPPRVRKNERYPFSCNCPSALRKAGCSHPTLGEQGKVCFSPANVVPLCMENLQKRGGGPEPDLPPGVPEGIRPGKRTRSRLALARAPSPWSETGGVYCLSSRQFPKPV